ncbi:hypothetical protein NE237_025388 [Protea cynaroides]|uniref:rRNA methyltransferase 1, mitochondrial n=1 Tax=Protea cynaroides TaxID=273540 RepID=A0A9Q0K0H8_9MAGN|nr:hypothetical protein NE237_025388 [Protea cynaroides]
MDVFQSQLEALAFNYMNFGFLASVQSLLTCIAIVTAAISFWKIRAIGSNSFHRTKSSDDSPPSLDVPPPPLRVSTWSKPEAEKGQLFHQEKTCSSFVAIGAIGAIECDEDYNHNGRVIKGKLTLYYDGDGVGVGDGDDVVCSYREELYYAHGSRSSDGIRMGRSQRGGDLGWYSSQDLTVLNGSSQVLPMVFRVSSQSKCFQHFDSMKAQLFSNGLQTIRLESLNGVKFRSLSDLCCQRTPRTLPALKSVNFSIIFHPSTSRFSRRVKPRNFSAGFHLRNTLQAARLIGTRNFSKWSPQKTLEGSSGAGNKKTFPWIAAYKNKEAKGLEKRPNVKTSRSSWEESADIFLKKNDGEALTGYGDGGSRTVDMMEGRRSSRLEKDERVEAEENYAENDNNPRWNTIRNRYRRITDIESGPENPDLRRWNKQENWGRKTWKEATESTIPKMVGEAVYGVGPVLAALSAGTREFYALYVQEGLDLSSNNRKKKDKKGFERVLKIAERIGLKKTQMSKHDLNMVVDNRPHQGLVLDASPLEMVSIRELDPVSVEEDKSPLWVALDEVTDPQNLGAIIRSAYFFGAAGVVLCAKNSAPLSGVVSKASAGSLELMEVRSCKNMMQFLTSSADNGWRVLGGSVSSKAVPLNEVLLGAPTVLVLGSEGTGLRPLVERSCTQLIRIPGNIHTNVSAGRVQAEETEVMEHGCSGEEFLSFLAVESLNVSVAAGVLLHHLAGNNINNPNSH